MESKKVIATGYKLPPFWDKTKVVVINLNDSGKMSFSSIMETPEQYSVTFKAPGLQPFTFPIDPFISLQFKNVITRRTVAKGRYRGTVKERWSEDDVEITFSGVFINKNEEKLPLEVNRLYDFFQYKGAIDVVCTHLNDLGITRIVLKTKSLPHTKGFENQGFEIKAYSDDVFELLLTNNIPYLQPKTTNLLHSSNINLITRNV